MASQVDTVSHEKNVKIAVIIDLRNANNKVGQKQHESNMTKITIAITQ